MVRRKIANSDLHAANEENTAVLGESIILVEMSLGIIDKCKTKQSIDLQCDEICLVGKNGIRKDGY